MVKSLSICIFHFNSLVFLEIYIVMTLGHYPLEFPSTKYFGTFSTSSDLTFSFALCISYKLEIGYRSQIRFTLEVEETKLFIFIDKICVLQLGGSSLLLYDSIIMAASAGVLCYTIIHIQQFKKFGYKSIQVYFLNSQNLLRQCKYHMG